MLVPRALPEGLFAGLALVLAAAYAPRRAPARGLSSAAVYRAWLCAALGGVLGGHALFLLTHGGARAADWLMAWSGQSVFGVLAGGALAGIAYLCVDARGLTRARLLDHADLAACAVALGYAVARLGCFFEGDDFGAPSAAAWAVRYAPGTEAWTAHAARGWIAPEAGASLAVHPVQLYLAAVGAAVFLILHFRPLPRGAGLGFAATAYGAARLLLEPLRDDFRPVAGPFALPQLIAILLLAGGALLLLRAHRTADKRQFGPSADAVEGVREGGLRAVVAAVSTAPAVPASAITAQLPTAGAVPAPATTEAAR